MKKTNFDGRIKDGKDEWLTPPYIIKALGEFDLDPCSPINRPWPTAKEHYTINDNGLLKFWPIEKRIFLNPPYGRETGEWLGKLACQGNGIALTFARTETKMFFNFVWDRADAILFIKKRLKFFHVSGEESHYSGGAPSCLIAYGRNNAEALKNSGIVGAYFNI